MTDLHPAPKAPARRGLFTRLGLLTALCLPLWLSGCGNNDEADAGDPGRPAIAVTWLTADDDEIRETRHAVGTVEALAKPLIAAQISGVITALHADEGERIGAGELLATIEEDDYRDERDRAAAEVARLTAQVGVQERNVRRTRELRADGHLSEDELDNAEAELEAREQELAAALSSLRRAERDLERTRIRSGIDGAVEARHISKGDYVAPGDPLFELVDTHRLQVRIPVSERLAPRIDDETTLLLYNRAAQPQHLETTVTGIRPSIGARTRSLQLLAAVENPGKWQPGASIDAEIVLDLRTGVVLPGQSVVRRPAGEVVYILDDDDETVRERGVETGTRMADRIEIRSGVEPGERVIVDGAGFLTDGASVRAEAHEDESAGDE
ncbi:efflux RND transporter periplasmic adaptor subunit [Halorhodospira abdelmalekii]|uniref:efflux RND transporter periplasmic adaptor subunit n=1 Tax=Halorhodospira abdelmalekii TaxID=421629 RepID=UPI0019088118|nr:efflux RND transporter periplasmic adaptor subunit [Halorhodospira abdelmalekii]